MDFALRFLKAEWAIRPRLARIADSQISMASPDWQSTAVCSVFGLGWDTAAAILQQTLDVEGGSPDVVIQTHNCTITRIHKWSKHQL